jgi:hypothetical protein
MKPHCFVGSPFYTPPECIPWPQNEHELHVLIVMRLVAWALGLIVMLWRTRQIMQQVEVEGQQRQIDEDAAACVVTTVAELTSSDKK